MRHASGLLWHGVAGFCVLVLAGALVASPCSRGAGEILWAGVGILGLAAAVGGALRMRSSPPPVPASTPVRAPSVQPKIPSELLRLVASQKKTIQELEEKVGQLEQELVGLRMQAGPEEGEEAQASLWSERHFRKVLDAEWRRSRRSQRPMSLLLVGFWDESAPADQPPSFAFWESHAQTLCRAVRGGDQVGLLPGGLLGVLLPETNQQTAKVAQERIKGLLEKDLHRDRRSGQTVAVETAVVTFPTDGKTPDELLAAGRKILLRAQRDRRLG